jgi:PadR family transcriptional regulator PadR
VVKWQPVLDSQHRQLHLPLKRSGEAVAELDLLQGTLDVLVLKTLTWGPKHGYAVAQWLRSASGDRILVEDKALYVALHRLEARGLIESEWGVSENNRKAKFYQLTTAGRRALRAKTAYWQEYSDAVFKVLGTADA